MASNEVWGIDIGKSGLKAVKMRRTKDQLEIVGIDIIEYEQSSDTENVDKEEQIQQALIEFQARNKIKKERVYASIPGQATFNRMITIPPVEAKRVKEIVTFEAQQQIPFPIEEVLWDYQLIGGKDRAEEEREVMLFAVRKEIINNFLANLAAAQLSVEGIQIAPLALYNFAKYERSDLETCVVVDIGAENTDLVVVDHDKLWIRALPSAGSDITKALQKRFNVPYAEAEKLKIKSGQTKQSQKIFEVMKPVLKDIVGEIHRSVGYYKSLAKESKFEKMIFMGNTTKLSGFEKFFSQNLQYEIEVLSKVERISVSLKDNLNLFQTNITSFAVAMGLAIQGLGLSVNKIRLLPEEVWKKGAIEKQKPIFAAAVAALAIIPVWLWFVNWNLSKSIKTTLSKIDGVLKPIQQKETELKAAKDYGPDKEELKEIGLIGKNRDIWHKIVGGINKIFLQANEKNKDAKGQIWMLGMSSEQKHQTTKMSEQQEVRFGYIETVFQIAFKSLDDPVKNRDYVITNFLDPLKVFLYREKRLLFDRQKTVIVNIENRDILFPGEEKPKEHAFCHAKLTIVAWLDMELVGVLPDPEKQQQNNLNEGNIPQELRDVLKENERPLSDMTTLNVKHKDAMWEIHDQESGWNFVLLRGREGLNIYKMDE